MSDVTDHGFAGAIGAAIVAAWHMAKRLFVGKSDLALPIAPTPPTPVPDARVDKIEARLLAVETNLAAGIAKLTAIAESQRDTSVRQWEATEKLTESVDALRGVVVKMEVEQALRRELAEKED